VSNKFSVVKTLPNLPCVLNGANNTINDKKQENIVKETLIKDAYQEVSPDEISEDADDMWKKLGCKSKGAGSILRKHLVDRNITIERFLCDTSGEWAMVFAMDALDVDKFQKLVLTNIQKTPTLEITKSGIENGTATLHYSCGLKYYIYQPMGSQKPPDLFLVEDNSCLCLECKSSKTGQVLWNGGLSKANYLYYFSSPAMTNGNGNIFFLGRDIIDVGVYNELSQHHHNQSLVSNQVNAKILAMPKNIMGWNYYDRAMYNMDGLANLTVNQINAFNQSALTYIDSL
jgi:hypothetical protein